MNISEEVKKQRVKHSWTQEQLAEMLNVSRPTVSSWEVGRNYPDLETIVAMSDLFEISLDDLLRGDKKMLDQITEDTKTRKTQSKKIKFLLGGLVFLFTCLLFLGYQGIKAKSLLRPDQIQSVELTSNNKIVVKTDLPFYRSLSGFMYNPNENNPSVMDITIEETIDWSLKNSNEIEVDINQHMFPKLTKVNIVNKYGKTIETLSVE